VGVFQQLRSRLGLFTAREALALYEKANPALPSFINEGRTASGGGREPLGQNFEQYLQSPGLFHTASACVDAIANASAAIPWKLMRTVGDGADEVTTHPLLDLLDNPNPEQGEFSFRFGMGQQIGYTGEAVLTTDNETGLGAKLVPGQDELWVLRTDRMKPVPNEAFTRAGPEVNPIREWIYDGPGGKVHFIPERVCQIKRPHPTDPWRGLSPLKQIETVLSIEFETFRQIRNYLKRGARPSSLFSREDRPTPEDVARFKEQFQAEYSGTENAGKTLFLWGKGLNFSMLGQSMLSPEVLQFLEYTQQAVMAVYKVPPLILASKDGQTWATSREQRKSFYTEAVMPQTELILGTLNASPLVRSFDNGMVYFEADYSGVEALQPDRESLAKVDHIAVADGTRTINEIRAARGYGEAVPWGDEPPARGGLPMMPFDDEQPAAMALGDANAYHKAVRDAKANRDKGDARALRWKAFLQRTQPIERAWMKALRPLFSAMQAEVMDTLERLDAGEAKSKAPGDPVPVGWTSADWFDLTAALDKWMDELIGIATRTMQTGAEDVLREVSDMFVPFDVEAPAVRTFIDERMATQIRTILANRQGEVRAVVERAVTNGQTVQELGKALREKFSNESHVWSQRIARTETAGLYNAGGQAGMVEAGVETKEWLSARDSDVRDSHGQPPEGIDGQQVPIHEDFHLPTGSHGPYPGEINSAEDNINCRCTTIPGDV
jgi:HK97 family phage portal protein